MLMKKIWATFLLILILFVATVVIITLGRGYRFDFGNKTLSSTGLLVATSDPDGAQVWLDGTLKSATNTTLTLHPGWYQVKISKEGYLPWEKKMAIQGEVVAETRATLFPSTPTLAPLTNSGVIAPTLSPDGTKVVYALPSPSLKAGLWFINLVSQPLGFSRDPQLLAKTTANLDFSAGSFSWSPDSKQVLVSVGPDSYLLEADKENQPQFLTRDALSNLLDKWSLEQKEKETDRLVTLDPDFTKIATESGKIVSFSPDETKILYQATSKATLPPILASPPLATNPTAEIRTLKPGRFYVYDLKEDKNFEISTPPDLASLTWFPSSRHLVEITSDEIAILEYDSTNKVTVYSGPFEKFVASSPSGTKLLILTSYNRPGGLANLYSVNLR